MALFTSGSLLEELNVKQREIFKTGRVGLRGLFGLLFKLTLLTSPSIFMHSL